VRARANLRKLFYPLQQALPEAVDFLEANAQTIQWRAAASFIPRIVSRNLVRNLDLVRRLNHQSDSSQATLKQRLMCYPVIQ
jgi:hypothetical protein